MLILYRGNECSKRLPIFIVQLENKANSPEILALLSCVMCDVILPDNHKDMSRRLSLGFF